MAELMEPPYIQFFDDSGTPLAGGKVYTYAAGTNTPKTSWTDASETTPAANPVTLDAAGRATMWINGAYKITVTSADGSFTKTTDNVRSFLSATGTTSTFDNLRATTTFGVGSGVSVPAGYLTNIYGGAAGSFTKYTNAVTGQTGGDGFDVGVAAGTADAYVLNKEVGNLYLGTSNTNGLRLDTSNNLIVTNKVTNAFAFNNPVASIAPNLSVGSGGDILRSKLQKCVLVGTVSGGVLTTRYALGATMTRSALGEFTVTLNTAMANGFYAIAGTAQRAVANSGLFVSIKQGTTPTTTSFIVTTVTDTATAEDPALFSITINGEVP